ncbi:hypothetical protein [Cognatishimia sp. MH4019]|uniref:hypothetical protein n=1 Tax=Cognatishimia sp. MH4019 TaxID=2854030 RepID=UPI001CD494AB|nr:hypothetical protein [Cognatishimia sp. MH4019]
MTKGLIASVLAAALALTSLPTAPARADDELAKILAAGTVLFIIGKAIENENKSKKRTKQVHHHHYKPKAKKKKHVHQRPHQSARLPGYCLTRVRTWEGPRKILSGRCLRRNYDYVDSLPRKCRRQVETYEGVRRGWGPGCLRKQGYVIAGR